jgi:crotonobetainyl-CoA:carnitine CoA-transferase CaiB-like acyl-CoA transferase
MTQGNDVSAQALGDCRVIELGRYVTASLAGQMLADLGADVIKIEDPAGGDPFRLWQKKTGRPGYGAPFLAFNRGKRSLCLDLRKPEAREAVRRLAKSADVLIENFRPGVVKSMSLDYESLREINPRLVYCAISGLGQEGPYASQPGYDVVGQGLSGLMSQLLDPDDPHPSGPVFSDTLTGMTAAHGVLAALNARERTGAGQKVDTSLLQATMSFLNQAYTAYLSSGRVDSPSERSRESGVYAFLASDRLPFVVQISSPVKFWLAFIRTAGRADLADDPRFATHVGRHSHWAVIHEELKPAFRAKPREEWLRLLREAGVPCAPIYRLDEALGDPQVEHLGLVKTLRHPELGEVRVIGPGMNLHGTPLDISRPPPALGEHSLEVLRELGYPDEEASTLSAPGGA